ncbi:PepSY-associated TM helix domain-containing protein [Oleiphilus messinensis]|uniref:PepSY-associated TM helix domain-containing protein n=1 Tax=Oleiphilus messinensis TaxID=141451 RepID=A0A1Y0ICL1_9GAMM|nr:PepSY-associated TM helix domain-containing protein [Oleiphilus messinensis]ARU58257.1 PepSY-associated TM helix domain-containing protein [Oleiphilus messinensis]
MLRILFTGHKYAGLMLGLLLSLTGLSGSILVFDHALDELLTPELYGIGDPQTASLQKALEAAHNAVPEGAVATRIDLARQPGSPHTIKFTAPAPENSRLEVSTDPGTAEVLVIREWGHYPLTWIYRFHYTLLSGKTGKTVVGVFGFVLLFFCISGIVLWWPRKNRRAKKDLRSGNEHWKRALTISHKFGPVRFVRDLHRVIGVLATPILMVCALTGIAMVFSGPVKTIVGTFTTIHDQPDYQVVPDGQHLPLDPLMRDIQKQWPDAQIKRIFLPKDRNDSLRINVNFAGESWTNHAASSIWVDPYRGEILGVRDARRLPAGDTILSWVFPLHNADALGMTARGLWLVTGTIPALLFISGIYLWMKKRNRLLRKAIRET